MSVDSKKGRRKLPSLKEWKNPNFFNGIIKKTVNKKVSHGKRRIANNP